MLPMISLISIGGFEAILKTFAFCYCWDFAFNLCLRVFACGFARKVGFIHESFCCRIEYLCSRSAEVKLREPYLISAFPVEFLTHVHRLHIRLTWQCGLQKISLACENPSTSGCFTPANCENFLMMTRVCDNPYAAFFSNAWKAIIQW